MSGPDNNRFKQVTTLLISITIIVSGIVYNSTITKTEAQFGVLIDEVPLLTNLIDNLQSGVNTNQTNTNPTPPATKSTNITTGETIEEIKDTVEQEQTNEIPLTNTVTISPSETAEKINNVLAPIEQFLSFMENVSFAYSEPDITLPDLPNLNTNSIPVISPETITETPKEIVNDVALPQIDETSQNKVLETIKKLTGYSKWEEFRDNLREAQQKYAGTGKCMIEIKGLDCLVYW